MVLDFASPGRGNQFGQGFAPDTGKREADYVRIAEKVVQKRLNGFQRVGSTELKENYPNTRIVTRHFSHCPQNVTHFTPNQRRESMAELQIPDIPSPRECRIAKRVSPDAS
jgi:hypothetical protein